MSIILLIVLPGMVWFKSGEMKNIQLSELPMKSPVSQISPSPESINDSTENTEEKHIQLNKENTVLHWKVLRMTVLQWMKKQTDFVPKDKK